MQSLRMKKIVAMQNRKNPNMPSEKIDELHKRYLDDGRLELRRLSMNIKEFRRCVRRLNQRLADGDVY